MAFWKKVFGGSQPPEAPAAEAGPPADPAAPAAAAPSSSPPTAPSLPARAPSRPPAPAAAGSGAALPSLPTTAPPSSRPPAPASRPSSAPPRATAPYPPSLRPPAPYPRAPSSAPATRDRAASRPSTPSPAAEADQNYLRALLDTLTGPSPPAEAIARLDDWSLLAAVDRLAAAGRGRTAVELLRRFVALPEALHGDPRQRPRLRARLGDLLVERIEYGAAVEVLTPIADDPEHGARARFLLGEAAERVGDLEGARLQFELVLTHNLDFPRARANHQRLRVDTGAAPSAAGATMVGLEADRATVGQRYRLRRELGRGATSTVYLAHDLELDREVALKLVHAQAAARLDADARLRSFGEARIAASLRHPGVVSIYDLDEERGLLVMELCAGGTLRERLAAGRLPPGQALAWAQSLLSTLAVVHEAGIVHRDVKPGNLLFRVLPTLGGEEGRAELVLGDFGLALFDQGQPTARPAGTLDYLAPEARRGEPSTAADVYAAGVILHEMLIGERPGGSGQSVRGDTAAPSELPGAVESLLGAAAAGQLAALLSHLLAPSAAARPPAAQAAAYLGALSG